MFDYFLIIWNEVCNLELKEEMNGFEPLAWQVYKNK